MSRGLSCALLAVVAAAAGAAGCKEEKESLLIVAVRTIDASGGSLTSLTLEVGRGPDVLLSRSYTLQAGLAMGTSVKYGIYIPGDLTGELRVTATAREGADCSGYRGSGLPTVVAAGDSVEIAMTLRTANVCPTTDGGAGSSGTGGGGPAGAGGSGTAGAGGSGPAGAGGSGVAGTTGTGGTAIPGCTGAVPPVGTPPKLTCCREYDHTDDLNCGVNAYIYSAAFSPDGRILMTGGDDGRIKLWTFNGNTLVDNIGTLPGAGYGYAALSKDGKIAVGLETGEVDVWSLTALTAAPIKLLSNSSNPYGVAFTADSQRVISIDSSNIYVHSVTGGTTTGTLTNVDNYFMTASPALVNNGTGVAVTGSDGLAAIYNITGATAGTPVILDVTLSPLLSAAFSPSGGLLALGDYDSFTTFWTYPVVSATQLPIAPDIVVDPVELYQTVNGIAFSPNGNYVAIAAGYPGDVSIWNVATRTEMYRYSLGTRHGLTAVFSPSGNALVVGERGCGRVLLCTE